MSAIQWILSFIIILTSPQAHATRRDCVYQNILSLTQISSDAAIEAEMQATLPVWRLITTEDGTVGALNQFSYPERLLENSATLKRLSAEKFPGVTPAEIRWDSLAESERIQIAEDFAKKNLADFFVNRTIPGLRVRDTINVKFHKTTTFQGTTYPPGDHTLELSRFFLPKVEASGPNALTTLNGVELHVRGIERTAGALYTDLRTLLESLGIKNHSQHAHLVGRLNKKRLKLDSTWYPGLMGDFSRRANLAAEMTSIIHDYIGIKAVTIDGAEYFGSMRRYELEDVTQYFIDLSRGIERATGDDFKIFWVGIRGEDKYDQPGLWGLEFRSLLATSQPRVYAPLLDALQYSIQTENFGVSEERFRKWLDAMPKSWSQPKKVGALWYNTDWDTLYKSAPSALKPKIPEWKKWVSANTSYLDDHTEVRMLLFDWSRDTVLFDRPDLQKQILDFQLRAISQVLAGEQAQNVVADFLVRSGLYDAIMQSLGMSLTK